jgi:luciferase family oxidoreductase group 1
MTKFSILDLAPIREGGNAKQALAESVDIAQHAENWNYERFWVAEHHNMRGIASAATSVVIGHLAGNTHTIRVGAGGIMLPNHSPLVIAEQFGTLATLYGNRIDLGLGRAPGADQYTMQALRRSVSEEINEFPRNVVELQHYLKPAEQNQRIIATPGEGTNVPLYILGSSLFGAQLAGMLGLPFAFASHFAPKAMNDAIEIYRNSFKASDQIERPYILLGFNICAADDEETATFLRTSSIKSLINLRRGSPGKLPPPEYNFEKNLTDPEREMAQSMGKCSAVGDTITVKKEISDFLDRTKANELILNCSIFDHEARLRSYEIASEVMTEINAKRSEEIPAAVNYP